MAATRLSDESIRELRRILKADLGVKVDPKTAKKIGQFLIRLYSHLDK